MPRRKEGKLSGSEFNDSKVVLALDISLSCTGWAVIETGGDNTLALIACGGIKTNPKQTHGERLRVIRKALEDICRQYDFSAISKERGFSRFPKETQALFKAHGVTEELFADFVCYDYAPTTVKKVVAGSGKASKGEVEQAVRQILELPETFEFESDNASDAAAVGITHIIKNKGA